jgi:hypothetical protein
MAEQAKTVAAPPRLPLVISPENRGDSTAFDARLVNCYMEKRENEVWIYERFGMDEHSRPSGGNATGRGMFVWRGNVYSIFGDTLYKDGVAVVGTVDTTNGVYRFDSCLGATPKMQLGNGVEAYNYDTSNGLVNISDADFPSSFCKGWAYLNATTYVARDTDGGIQGDDANTPTDWDPLNVIIAQIEPDINVALAKQLVYVIALKQWSGEVFYDAGNVSGSPLGRVEGSKFNWGCLSEDSPREIDGALAFLGATRNGQAEVVLLNNLKAEAISTKPIERLLNGGTFTNIFSWTIKYNGHRFYVLTLKDENLTLAYDLDEREWCQWTDVNGNYLPIVDSCVTTAGVQLLQHESNGRIYIASDSYATDDGDLIQVDIYTPNFDGGTRRRKQMKILKVISDQKAGSILQCRYNDSDFAPLGWSNFRNFDLSQPDPQLPDWGTFVRRAHNFRHKSPVRMPRIMAVEPQIDIGTL